MPWKMEGNNIAVVDGNPVWIDGGGAETAVDYHAATVKIATLNRENGEHRTKLKEANEKLAAFSGIEDPAAALKALQFAASMDGKKVMDDEGIAKLIQAAVKPLQEKLTATETALGEKDAHIYKLEVSNNFKGSQFIKDKVLVPADMLEATFGKHFTVDGGKLVAKDSSGNQIFNTKGEPASFDEAIQTLIEAHPMKDTIYKASGSGGSGSRGGDGSGKQTKTMTREQWDTISHTERSEFSKAGGKVVD